MSSPEANAPEASPRPHLEHRLVLSQDSHGTVHGTGTMGRFNTWLAVRITKTVGTMWVAYIFAAIALVSLPAAIQSQNVIIIAPLITHPSFHLLFLPTTLLGH